MEHIINGEFKDLLPPWASQDLRFALVKFGGGVVQMAGSIAGDTFARNRYGNYVRARTKPTNPNTPKQQAIRAAVAEAVARWSDTVTAAQRAAWGLYGDNVAMKNRLGETMKLSGFNHYIRSNAMLMRLGLTPVDIAPVIFEIPAHDPSFALTASEAAMQLSISFDNSMAWANEDDAKMYIHHGMPQNAQRNFFAGPWRYVGLINGNAGVPPTSPWTCAPAWTIAEGQHIWVYARILRADGRLSEPFRADSYVSA